MGLLHASAQGILVIIEDRITHSVFASKFSFMEMKVIHPE